MDQDSKDFEVFRIRSVGASIRDGYRLYLDCFRRIFRATWLMALLYALVTGIASTLLVKEIPEFLFTNTETLQDMHIRHAFIIAGICTIVMFSEFLLYAVGFSLLNSHQRTGTMPTVTSWLGYYDGRIIVRTVISFFVLLLLVVAYFPAFATLTEFLNKHLSTMALGAATLLVLIATALVIPPVLMYLLKYILSTSKPGKPNMPLRYWGSSIMIAIVVLIVTLLLSLVTDLPTNILTMANIQSQTGALKGDSVGMPEYMQWMNIIAFSLAGFIKAYVSLSALFPFYYLYGSIEAQEKERVELTQKFNNI